MQAGASDEDSARSWQPVRIRSTSPSPDSGTYVESEHDNQTVEAWLPVNADAETIAGTDASSISAGVGQGVEVKQIGYGAAMYLLVFAQIGLGLTALRGTKPSTAPRSA